MAVNGCLVSRAGGAPGRRAWSRGPWGLSACPGLHVSLGGTAVTPVPLAVTRLPYCLLTACIVF